MNRLRFTIAQTMAAVFFLGFGFAALRSPSWIWASTLFSVVATLLAVATLTAVYRLGARRAFWTGFALCGWLYLGMSAWPWSGSGSNQSALIVTSALMDLAYPTIQDISNMRGSGAATAGIWRYWSEPPRDAAPFNWAVPEPYRVICHSMLTPFFALLGGLLARRLYRTRDESGA